MITGQWQGAVAGIRGAEQNGDHAIVAGIPYPVGNIREMPLPDLLNNDRYLKFRRALKEAGGVFPGCARCCKLYRGGLKRKRASRVGGPSRN